MKTLPSSSSRTSVLSWRRRLLASVLSPLVAVASLLTPVHAQTSAVPGLISYQGKVSNAAGTAVGAGTPVNRLVIFRIWSHQSNSTINDLVYSEQQTVTISEGEFSVLIGQGAAVSGTPLGYSEATKGPGSTSITSASVFAGATRFLGVTIDDGTGAADPEVSPRQQLVSSAYAMRAKYAESVGSNGANTITALDNGNVGVGTANPGVRLDVNGTVNVFDSGIKSYPGGLVSEVGSQMVNFGINDSRFGTQTNAAQGGFLRLNTQNVSNLFQFYARPAAGTSVVEVMSITNAGNVGIGQSAPGFPLNFASTVGDKISLHGNSGAHYGFGIQPSLLQIHTPTASDDVVFGYGSSASFTETMRVKGNGNVGIGTNSPTAKLHVNGGITSTSLTTSALNLSGPMQASGAVTTHSQGAYLEWNKASGGGQTYLLNQRGLGSGGLIFGEVSTADVVTENMRITADGKVGIGTSAPAARLDLAGGGIMLNSGINNAANRPAVGAARLAGEIGAYGSGGTGTDDGFLRLSAGGGTTTSAKSFIDVTGYSTVADMNATVVFGTAGAERMRINNSGNVGIGTSSPASKLEVNGLIGLHDGGSKSRNAGIQTEVNGQLINLGVNDSSSNRFGGSYTSTDQGGFFRVDSRAGSLFSFHARAANGTATTEVVTITSGGRMGINTGSPSAPLHVAASASVVSSLQAYMDPDTVTAAPFNQSFTGGYSIIGDARIRGSAFDVHSDRRIKNVVGKSSGAADLSVLMGIEVTDYTFKDSVAHSGRREKKVIAQQIEQVFPQAVARSVSVVPDIMRKGQASGAWITAETDLEVGERVRLMAGDADSVHEVLEVQPGRFRTAFAPAAAQVFVYGREVKDFRTVDYDAIAMLNVSATQELARQVEALKASEARNAELTQRVAELEAKDRARDAKLAAIEKLLSASSTVMAQPAKSATANGQE